MWTPTCSVTDAAAVGNFSEDKVPSSVVVSGFRNSVRALLLIMSPPTQGVCIER